MAILILILIALACYHLLMESLVIPLIRIQVEYKLSALNDELILLKIRDNQEITDSEFEWLKLFINKTKVNLPNLNYLKLFLTSNQKLLKNEDSGKVAEQNANKYINHQVPAIKRIFNETMKSSFNGYIINMLGWFIYIVPLLLIFIVIYNVYIFVNK